MSEQATPQETPPKKKKGLLRIILLLVIVLALGGGGYFAFTMFIKPKFLGGETQVAEADAGKGGKAEKAEGGHGKPEKAEKADAKGAPAVGEQIVTMPPFVVNLNDPMGKRYLKLALNVELKDADSAKEMAAKDAVIRDAVIMLLSSKSYQDLSTMEAKILLKKELAERLNQSMGGSKITRVYITDMVVQ